MNSTKEKLNIIKKQKNSKHKNTMTLKNKTLFICLLSVLLIFILLISSLTNKINNESGVKVSGVVINPEEYNDMILVELQPVEEENNIIENEEQTSTEPTKDDSTNNTTEKKEQPVNKNPYYIKVNYGSNVVTIYALDVNGNYTVPVKAMLCSSGKDTPRSGVYKTPAKYRWILLIGDVWGQYSTRITGGILFHSVPYTAKSPSSLKANYYDKLGYSVSAGCIRLTVADAKWIYDNCPIGTQVEFYSSSNPGPLGKPTTMKISGYPTYLKQWDPTDPDPNNPWIGYFRGEQNTEQAPTTPEQGNTSNQNGAPEQGNTSTPGIPEQGNTSNPDDTPGETPVTPPVEDDGENSDMPNENPENNNGTSNNEGTNTEDDDKKDSSNNSEQQTKDDNIDDNEQITNGKDDIK